MRITSVALKYARALVEVALESGRADDVRQELGILRALLEEHVELREVLENPAIPFSAKRIIIERLAPEIPLQAGVRNFVLILLEKARFHQFDEMEQAYDLVLDERRGILRGQVHTAVELEGRVKTRLQQTMSKVVGQEVKLSYHLEESLIGGLKVQVGSTIFDGSIRAQLEKIGKQIAS